LKWAEIFNYALGTLKYLFLGGLALFLAYMIGLLRKNVD
jgi:hypothetical protein